MKSFSIIHNFIFSPLLRLKPKVIGLILALILIALSQSMLLILMGPFIKALFGFASDSLIKGKTLFSSQILSYFPQLGLLEFTREELAFYVPLGLLCAAGLKNIAAYLYEKNSSAIALYVATNYRIEFFKTILNQPYLYIQSKSPASWMSHIMNDVLYLQSRFSDILRSLLHDSILMIAALVTMWLIHWPTALVLTLLIPLVMRFAGQTGSRISHYAQAYQSDLANLAAHLLDIRKRFSFIRAQSGEKSELKRFEKINLSYLQRIRRSILVRAAFAPGMEFFGFCLFAILLLVIGNLKNQSSFSSINLFIFFAALGMMLRPLRSLGEQLARLHETTGALKESLSIFKQTANYCKTLSNSTKDIKNLAKTINLKLLNYKISQDLTIALEGISLHRGMTIAIIGPSGAGKSTILKIFAGLIEPERWEGDINWQELAYLSSFVSQTPFLFHGTLRENLEYGNKEYLDESAWKSLETVGIKDEIMNLKDGLDTHFNPVNTNLSGGQIQRLVIARALLRQKMIWLFDEATSAVDTFAEKQLLAKLQTACKSTNSILLMVTHRLQLLAMFDEIWFVKSGQIIMKGKHEQLLNHSEYAEFYQNT